VVAPYVLSGFVGVQQEDGFVVATESMC